MRFWTSVSVLSAERVIVKAPLPDPPLVVTPLGREIETNNTSPPIPSVSWAVMVPLPNTVEERPVVVVRSRSDTEAALNKSTGSMDWPEPVLAFSVTLGLRRVAERLGASLMAVTEVFKGTVSRL